MIIFADTQTINQASKQILNSKTEALSYPLWIVGERANNLTKLSSKTKELVSYWSDLFNFYMFQNVGYSKLFETPISNIDLYEVL